MSGARKRTGSLARPSEKTPSSELIQKLFDQMSRKLDNLEERVQERFSKMDQRFLKMKDEMSREIKELDNSLKQVSEEVKETADQLALLDRKSAGLGKELKIAQDNLALLELREKEFPERSNEVIRVRIIDAVAESRDLEEVGVSFTFSKRYFGLSQVLLPAVVPGTNT